MILIIIFLKSLKKNKNIDLILSSEVLNIRKEEKSISVTTNKNKYICKHVFDSRPENIKVIICGSNFLVLY